MTEEDIPSDHDFSNPTYVRQWLHETTQKNPERPAFFDAFVAEVTAEGVPGASILELGSGPGVLAEQLLDRCDVGRYWLVDFSAPMHEMARERLGDDERVVYVEADFKQPSWTASVSSPVDIVVSLQALHELRHCSRVPGLYRQVTQVLRPGGLILICDHLRPDDDQRALFMTIDEHLAAMKDGGLAGASLVLAVGNKALFKGRS